MVESVTEPAVIKTQIEYYLSDTNLSHDRFFREQIQTDKEGWVAIAHFLNCRKIQAMKIDAAAISGACADSTQVEVNADKTKIRRAGNKALPERSNDRKRDAKAAAKGAQAAGEADAKQEEDQFDADGKVILVEKDFDNP